MLARAYNNNEQIEEAMRIMDEIPEEERDAVWYYRYGYSYSKLSENCKYDMEKESLNALVSFEKAIAMAKDDEVKEWCMELVEAYGFKTILENNKEKLPFVYERYLDYVSQFSEEEFPRSGGGRTYKKITVDDVKNIEEIWDILDPVYWTIDIYSSYKDYLKSAESFTLEQRYLNATTWA